MIIKVKRILIFQSYNKFQFLRVCMCVCVLSFHKAIKDRVLVFLVYHVTLGYLVPKKRTHLWRKYPEKAFDQLSENLKLLLKWYEHKAFGGKIVRAWMVKRISKQESRAQTCVDCLPGDTHRFLPGTKQSPHEWTSYQPLYEDRDWIPRNENPMNSKSVSEARRCECGDQRVLSFPAGSGLLCGE